jgi:hypothetical protein
MFVEHGLFQIQIFVEHGVYSLHVVLNRIFHQLCCLHDVQYDDMAPKQQTYPMLTHSVQLKFKVAFFTFVCIGFFCIAMKRLAGVPFCSSTERYLIAYWYLRWLIIKTSSPPEITILFQRQTLQRIYTVLCWRPIRFKMLLFISNFSLQLSLQLAGFNPHL